MTKRVLLGTLVGGIVVFFVGALLHTVLGLGEVGVKALPQEDTVLSAMRSAIHDPGFYIFPAPNMTPGRTKQQVQSDTAAYMAKYQQGPSGILVYSTGSAGLNYGKLLGGEFVIDLVSAFFLSCILAMGAGGVSSYWKRVFAVTLAGLFAVVFLGLEYWNWYNFPTNYTCGYIVTGVLDWFFAGLAMA
ncbi:MAG TPA: hypothetical protein VJN90_11910, partial [Candidatus Acidoferrales bacterium]|nr:hypothetical protein [Candidatus Acidoferrales bacterium]